MFQINNSYDLYVFGVFFLFFNKEHSNKYSYWLDPTFDIFQNKTRPRIDRQVSVDRQVGIIINYNTHSTQKSPVRQQNAWFDTKKPGSTHKCPVRHKNALPSMHQLALLLSNIPPAPSVRYMFFQSYSNILFWEPIEKWKWNYIDMNSKLVY